MAEFTSRAVGSAGLTTGIIGTSLGALNSGLLGNIFGGGNAHPNCSEQIPVTRYEMGLQQELASKNSRISLLESNIYVDSKIADVYERLNTKIGVIEKQVCDQAVWNAAQTAAVNCLSGQVGQLLALTKLVVPATSICPQPTTTATTTAAVI